MFDRRIFEIDLEILRLENATQALERKIAELKAKRSELLKEFEKPRDAKLAGGESVAKESGESSG